MVDPRSLKFPRQVYQQHFASAFAELGQAPHNVLVFYGGDGFGKSTLRNLLKTEYSTQAIALNGASLHRYHDVAADPAMHLLQTQLQDLGIALPNFDLVYAYWSEWARLGQAFDPDQLAKSINQGDIPNSVADLLSPLQPASGIVSSLTWFLRRFSVNDGQQQDLLQPLNACSTSHELRQKLPQYLMQTLRLTLQDQDRQLAILIDDYEDLLDDQGRYLWLEEMMAVDNPSVLWVLFAQDVVASLPASQQIQLEPLNQAESLEWLRSWGIDDFKQAQAIAQSAQGNPFELRCRFEAFQSDEEIAAEPLEDVLFQLMHVLPDSLIEMVCCVAVARTWDVELFSAIAKYLNYESVPSLLSQVIGLPFVESVGSLLWQLHPLMAQYLQQQYGDLQQAVMHDYLYEHALLQCVQEQSFEKLMNAIYHGLRGNYPHVAGSSMIEAVTRVQAACRHLEAIALLRVLKPMELRLPIELRAIATTQFGVAQAQLERWEEAIVTLEQAQSLWIAPQNRLRTPFAAVEFYLAQAYFHIGRLHDAQTAARRANHLRLDEYGVDSLPVAEALTLLAQIATQQNQYSEALDFTEQALRIYALHPKKSALHLVQLQRSQARLLYQLNRLDDGLRLCQSTLELAQMTLGANHPEVIVCLEQLGSLYEVIEPQQFAQAHECYKQALAIGEPLLGTDHPLVQLVLKNLSQICHKLEQLEAAEDFAQRCHIPEDSLNS